MTAPKCPHGEPLAGCPDTYPDDRPEHLYEPPGGNLTGCARCGYGRGHHPTRATLAAERRAERPA